MSEHIGHICLNVALILYLLHYLPQLIHNRKAINLAQINLHFHGLLSISYLTDLTFAVGMNMPWQYCLVSTVGVLCLLTQNTQLKTLYRNHKQFTYYQGIIGIFIIIFCASIYMKLPTPFFLAMGYLCQASVWIYSLPQIWQNYVYKRGNGLNGLYLGMNLACYSLDIVASTTLNWPIPAKIGALFGFSCTTILLYQLTIYKTVKVEQMA